MKRLLALIIISGMVYGGWVLWQQTRPSTSTRIKNISSSPTLSLQDPKEAFSSLEAVLGESISSGVEVVSDKLNAATGGASEPIINQAISNFQTELKKLPEDQMKKVQYNYCKTVVNEYESNQTQ